MERLVGVLLFAAMGCFEPNIRDAQITCEGADELCPTGFVCLDGLCRNQAPEDDNGKTDDPTGNGPDAGMPPDDPDAGPIPGPKVYSLTNGTWTHESAGTYFAGSGVDIFAIVTAWSQCDGGTGLRCFADASNVACTDGTTWATASWNEIDNNLSGFGTTFTSTFDIGNNDWALYAHRGEDWRGYEGNGLSISGTTLNSSFNLEVVSGNNGVPDLDQIYGDDPNAPNRFDDVVADYIDVTKNGDPWSFLLANGSAYTVKNNGPDTTRQQDPSLALPGAPLAADIRAALMCGSELMFYAVD